MLKENHFESFVRIHRSYAVPKHRVERIGSTEIELVNNIKLPIGNSFKQNLSLL
ncbi:MAG: LytTR family transcriptional regulator DNA-binding domain-containing protein [Flavobacteriaceae bacterium]